MNRFVLIVPILLVVAIAGCVGQSEQSGQNAFQAGSGVQSGSVVVRISDFTFQPANVTVRVNSTVTWINYDTVPHLIFYDSGGPMYFGGFGSPTLSPGMNWSWTPQMTGTFNYICSIHPTMKGMITVVLSGDE